MGAGRAQNRPIHHAHVNENYCKNRATTIFPASQHLFPDLNILTYFEAKAQFTTKMVSTSLKIGMILLKNVFLFLTVHTFQPTC